MAVTAPPKEGPAGTVRRGRHVSLTPYLFLLPHFIFFVVFVGYPLFRGLYISFFEYDFLRPAATRFVGLRNYVALFTAGNVTSNEFWQSMKVTVTFVALSVPLLILVPFGLALLLNTKVKGTSAFRALYFAPWVLSAAVISLIWWWIFQSQGGLLNFYLAKLGLATPRWLSTMPYAMWTIVIATVWWTMGYNMIILLAGMQDIPPELYEAAQIDGANRWSTFKSITVPMLRPVLVFIITLTIIASFNLLAQPMMMTRGDPRVPTGGGATQPVMLEIYTQGFVRPFQGSAAAMSFIVAAIMIVFSLAQNVVLRRRELE
jgi:multiple sugar transport system permease protein